MIATLAAYIARRRQARSGMTTIISFDCEHPRCAASFSRTFHGEPWEGMEVEAARSALRAGFTTTDRWVTSRCRRHSAP